jgi:hypothetical protein
MFNELEVSVLGLFVLNLNYTSSIFDKPEKIVIQAIEKDLVLSFLQMFTDLGIEKKFIPTCPTTFS